MFYLSDFCWICLNNKNNLKHMSDGNGNKVSYYAKLLSSVKGTIFKQINERSKICESCRENVDFIYQFHRKCMSSYYRLEKYITQMRIVGKTEAVMSVHMMDFAKSCVKQEVINPEYNTEENTDFSDTYNMEDAEHMVYFPEIHHINIKTENMGSDYETTENEDLDNCLNDSSDKLQTEHLELKTDLPICPGNIKKEITDVELNATSHVVDEDLGESYDPVINLDDIKSDTDHTRESPDFGGTQSALSSDQTMRSNHTHKHSEGEKHNFVFVENDTDNQITENNDFNCDKCGKAFTSKPALEAHCTNNPHKFVCNVCGKSYVQKPYLILHMRSHDEKMQLICETCGKVFNKKSNFDTHMRAHTKEKPYTCTICSKQIASKQSLVRHMNLHSAECPFICNQCGNKFSSKHTLNTHQRLHTGIKPFECSVCNKKFSTANRLTKHKITHTGIKQHQCTVCHKKFGESGNLTRHMLIHTGLRPHECYVCKKTFNDSGNLARHVLIHTGLKPHACWVCHRKFSEAGTLKKHLIMKHTGKNFK